MRMKQIGKRLVALTAAILLMTVLCSCEPSVSDAKLSSPTTVAQNQAKEDVPGNNTGDGEDKTDDPVAVPSDPQTQPTTPNGNQETPVEKAPRDMSKGLYSMPSNIPQLSPDGVQGKLKEVYYTTSGGLAITLNLSNGMATEQRVSELGVYITNDQNTAITENLSVKPDACFVPAGGYAELYFEVEATQVLTADDPLTALVMTMTATSVPVESGEVLSPDEPIVLSPKDPVATMTYYEDYSNMPAASADAVNATVVRAQYTNDGSLRLKVMLANGATADKTVSNLHVVVVNAEAGVMIAEQAVDTVEVPCIVPSNGTVEYEVLIDQANVFMKYDTLQSVAATVQVTVA